MRPAAPEDSGRELLQLCSGTWPSSLTYSRAGKISRDLHIFVGGSLFLRGSLSLATAPFLDALRQAHSTVNVPAVSSVFLAFLLVTRFASACPSLRHLSLDLPKTKSLLPPNVFFLFLYFLVQGMTEISTQSLKPEFSSSSLNLHKDSVTKSVSSHTFSKSTSPTCSSPFVFLEAPPQLQVSADNTALPQNPP